MGHGHHHHVDPEAGDRRVFAAIAVNLGLTAAQILGGIVSGSLALIADALHNFSDAISLIIAFGARKIARRPRNAKMTFGYGRVEVVAALINYTTLIVTGLYLLYEAAMRFADPQDVEGWLIVVIAGIALVVDAATAMLTYTMSKSSVNIRAAFLHNVADALGSVAVIVAGTLILLYDWRLVDPIVTVLIAGYILWQSFREIGPVIRILMLGSPPEIETGAVLDTVRDLDGVAGIHHAHFWQMDEHRAALDAHVVIAEGRWSDADAVKEQIKTALADRFNIEHTTLELECARHACDDPSEFGGRGHKHKAASEEA
ncbi:cation diffusion facilitator family transporter [Sulfitobacter sp. M220]|jgi:cobalt-zinc-cadmium efflux system protein|uniref:cation diffusion facilitator family transporter n=1 Tax=unclassified Sulfitobacter TaxID=196795 RepID=UPI001EF15DBB|nr:MULTISPECIES: cation diffusion facilitator family transporter [unclassified Sulfitobacter]MCF7728643.1 cation diffusion facilitator family transporter [Sulfitobacter sp. M22]MCF7779706.1 cation diffusion facilitator family transporter [Sulfitobacter sp. M220]